MQEHQPGKWLFHSESEYRYVQRGFLVLYRNSVRSALRLLFRLSFNANAISNFHYVPFQTYIFWCFTYLCRYVKHVYLYFYKIHVFSHVNGSIRGNNFFLYTYIMWRSQICQTFSVYFTGTYRKKMLHKNRSFKACALVCSRTFQLILLVKFSKLRV